MMSFAACVTAAAGLALVVIASSPVAAAEAYDRCAYMNHDSKAYKTCMIEEAAARQRVEAEVPPVAKPQPAQPPRS
jgi:hypothetical protein